MDPVIQDDHSADVLSYETKSYESYTGDMTSSNNKSSTDDGMFVSFKAA